MLIYLASLETPQDRAKFQEIYETYKGLLFHVALKILENPQDAEDAVHETFVSVAENFEKIHGPKCHKTKSYLVTIVEHKAIDLYRKKKNHPKVALDDAVMGFSAAYEGDDGLARCILKLPARYRDFLLLKYDQGYENKELEKILGLSPSAVRKLDQRARDKLEQLCREEGLL
jgi:RNA polymerase sigma-70 factor (ECF subfamily)